MGHEFSKSYTGENLNRAAFPLGGLGAGMVCLEGNGSLSHVSVRHRPEVFHQPLMFGAISVKTNGDWRARVLQGRTADWKVMAPWGTESSGNGGRNTTFGFPYFRDCSFEARFPFATVSLGDEEMGVRAAVTGWSPFLPGNADDSGIPMGVLEYTFENPGSEAIECVFTFASENFMRKELKAPCCGDSCDAKPAFDYSTRKVEDGFVLHQARGGGAAHRKGSFAVVAMEPARVNCGWFRGAWFDHQTILWRDIAAGRVVEHPGFGDGEEPSLGGSLAVPFALEAGASKTVKLMLAWHVPYSDVRVAFDEAAKREEPESYYRPWYAEAFADVDAIVGYGREHFDRLREDSEAFSRKLHAAPLPAEVLEAVSANLTILKSPTVLRQFDGRLWCWEGCCDESGCCHGSCTHVWNYAQAVAHLFPEMERTLRQTEFHENQDEHGHQNFRANLPISPAGHECPAAADGQLGGIMKVHRDWQICRDDAWLRGIWPKVRQSLEYCITTWDPDRTGMLVEPHHNTYDIEFWGANGMTTSFYLGALKAAARLADVVGEDGAGYRKLFEAGRAAMERELWNGEYFVQKIRTEGMKAGSPTEVTTFCRGEELYRSPEGQALLKAEGPKYQYGEGCLSDGVLGAWMAEVCGVGEILDPEKVRGHLLSVFRYNYRRSLHDHANPQRPTFALNDEAGLVLCSWPRGGRLTLPFPYSEEVWTGIEYQVASHLAMMGEKDKCLEIVRAVRNRYDGRVRNPFNEYECGHWYARALSSFALVQAFGIELG